MFTLKGFPTEVSEFIELPSIAELLIMPSFFDTDIDEAYKHGTDFQKKLIEMTPLRGNKNTISVLSEVRMLAPKLRSCTMGGHPSDENFMREWHIDCEENEDGSHIYHEERDIVHLLSNEVSCLTEFNENEVIFDFDPLTHSYNDFMQQLIINADKIKAKKMPHNKIVTFTNHLHRAVNPSKLEFRYMFRIVETDRKRLAGSYNKDHVTNIILPGGENEKNIVKSDNKITLFMPSILRDDPKFKHSLPDSSHVEENHTNSNNSASRNKKIDKYVGFESEDKFNEVRAENIFVEGNTVVVETMNLEGISKESINFFIDNFDSKFKIKESNHPENFFTLVGKLEMVNDNLIRAKITVPSSEVQHLKSFESYVIECFQMKNSLYSIDFDETDNTVVFK